MANSKDHIRGKKFSWISKFLCRFIKDFSLIATPLIEVIKKSVGFKWGVE